MFRRLRRSSFRRYTPSIITPNPNSRQWRVSQIRQLSLTNTYFSTVFVDPASPFITSISRLSEVFGYTDDMIRQTDKFKQEFGSLLCNMFSKETAEPFKTSWGYTKLHSSDFLMFIKNAKDYLQDSHKESLLNSFLLNFKNFTPTGKKSMSHLATDFVKPNDPRAIDILRVFLRNLETLDISVLLEKIPGGLSNSNVQSIVKKTKTLEYLLFDEQAFQTDAKRRAIMVKKIAKTPSLIRRLPFQMVLTLDDLNTIAPAMRFAFVQYALQCEIRYSRWKYTGSALQSRVKYLKGRKRMHNLEMPMLTVEQMKELLVSVCLKKNDEFSLWIEKYEEYVNALAKV